MNGVIDALCAELEREGVATHVAAGFVRRGGEPSVGGRVDTFFDLASLTKPFVALATARSGVDREATLEHFVPEARGLPAGGRPLEWLFAHRADLAAHLPLYRLGAQADQREALRQACLAVRGSPLVSALDGYAPLYSDLGYLLAGEAVHRATGDLEELVRQVITRPLRIDTDVGSARSLRAIHPDFVSRAAPTEACAWRGRVVRAEVHDENAWAIGGLGLLGHAGLFGRIGGVLRFVGDALNSVDDPRFAWLFRERQGGTLRAGFDGKSASNSSAGTVLGPSSVGHLGFTGTSFWLDPERGLGVALLTNRVHPSRANSRIVEARPRAHDILANLAMTQRSPLNRA